MGSSQSALNFGAGPAKLPREVSSILFIYACTLYRFVVNKSKSDTLFWIFFKMFCSEWSLHSRLDKSIKIQYSYRLKGLENINKIHTHNY